MTRGYTFNQRNLAVAALIDFTCHSNYYTDSDSKRFFTLVFYCHYMDSAEDKVRDRLAQLAREKLGILSKEKQLQLERKKKAMAFLTQIGGKCKNRLFFHWGEIFEKYRQHVTSFLRSFLK